MMKTLLILRHAKSSWKDVTLADHDRPLNKRGLRDAPAQSAPPPGYEDLIDAFKKGAARSTD